MALTQARVHAAIDAAVSTTSHAQLHTGDPGAAGTANVAAGVSRAALAFPTASTGGTYCGSGTLTPAESFAGAGTLDVTVTVTGASI